jgi:hypothetical protein
MAPPGLKPPSQFGDFIAHAAHEAGNLERNHDSCAIKGLVQGVDFLRKSTLQSCAFGYTYRGFAVVPLKWNQSGKICVRRLFASGAVTPVTATFLAEASSCRRELRQ